MPKPNSEYSGDVALDKYIAAVEAEIIRDVIIREKGNVSHAAEALHIKRQTLQHKLKKYHIVG